MSPPPRPRFLSRPAIGWCAFDFANSSYTTLITTVAFSTYFTDAVVGHADPRRTWYWGLAGVVVNVLLILTSPVLGALADRSGRKKRFLLLTAVQTVIATALLATVGPGDVAYGFLLYVVATLGFEGGYTFYNAFLPEVSTPENSGRISALAWGVGFAGGLASLAACIPFLARRLIGADGLLDPSAVFRYRLSFLVVAGFFALFSLPTFLWLKETPSAEPLPRVRDYALVGFRRVADTLRHLRRYRQVALFILAYVFFFGGVNVVIRFSAIFAKGVYGIDGVWLLALFAYTNVVAVPGTIGAGWLADRIGPKRALELTLVIWVAVALAGAFGRSLTVFLLMAAGAAVGMGSTQSIGRAFMARISPAQRESEFFGFYVLAGQVGSIVAFLVYGAVSAGSGDQRLAVLWTLPFFVVGLLLTALVNERKALQRADTSGANP